MADIQMISTSTLIASIIGSILGSGVISAVVSGLFNNSSKDNEWRSNHLSEDKKIVRNILDQLHFYLELVEPLKNNHNKQYLEFDITTAKNYMSKLTRYLDIRNKYAAELLYTNEKLIGHLYNYVSLWHQFNEELEGTKPSAYKECLYLLEKSARIAQLYFAEYYPKPSIWSKICKCLCG